MRTGLEATYNLAVVGRNGPRDAVDLQIVGEGLVEAGRVRRDFDAGRHAHDLEPDARWFAEEDTLVPIQKRGELCGYLVLARVAGELAAWGDSDSQWRAQTRKFLGNWKRFSEAYYYKSPPQKNSLNAAP